ncbi:MAG: TonB-dependent receptor [Alistipes sp.]|nr:TonB-dependent receptor [Alistipes sp.]
MKGFSSRICTRLFMTVVMLFCIVATAMAQKVQVTGKVSDKDGAPLAGATVVISGTTNGVLTDNTGKYTITVPSGESILEIEYLGFVAQKIKVGTKTTINVILQSDAKQVDEVVVIGYGETRKSDLTGSVTNVKMSDVQDAPVASVDQALQGRVAGADIMSTSGDPTAATSIRIRGTRSIEASNEPLIVVDGVIDAVSDMGDLNPSDIESISVLKDASSTAIYGAQGANGVIIVTTKKGAPTITKPNIVLGARVGMSMLARNLDTMTAAEFAQYRNEVTEYNARYSNDVTYTAKYADPQALGKGTNWIDAITRIAPYQNYWVSISGRTKKTNYWGSISYSGIDGIVDESGKQQIFGRFNIGHQFNKWFKLSYSTNALYRIDSYNKAAIGGTNYWTGATYLNPILDQYAAINDLYENGTKFNNPYVTMHLNEDFREGFSSNNTVTFEFKPVKGLTIKSQNSYYLWQAHRYRYYPSTLPMKNEGDGGETYRVENDRRQIASDNTITYKNDFKGGHHFDAMVGFSSLYRYTHETTINAKGMLIDNVKWNDLAGISDKNNYTISSWDNKLTRMSVLGRINYNYKKRYYFTFTGRADGSSNFAKNKKWGFFPSGAFKWVISNENWLKSNQRVNELALRVSAGRSGNDAIAQYRSLAAMDSSTSGYLFNGVQSTYYYPSRVASNNLSWETTDLYNVALDMSFCKDRLKFTVEGYLGYTHDLLLYVQRPTHTGYSSFLENIGRTSNKGVELTINSRNITKRNFSWTTDFTISHNRQMVEDIGTQDFVVAMTSPGNGGQMMYGYVQGRPLNSLWGYEYGGVAKNTDEIERNKLTKAFAYPSTTVREGVARYVDQNHDGVLDQQDLVYLGNADPYVYGGLQNTFNIYGLRVGIYFAYSIGGKIYNYSEFYMSGSYMTSQYRYMKNAWHPTRNPDSFYPAAGSAQIHVPSSLQVHDASYLRLKSVNISYTFDLRKKTKLLRDIKIGVNADNLFLWSNYNGFDPDVSTESGESTLRRVDMGAYPRARTITFDLQIRY